VCKMWQQQFSSLYNSLDRERAKQKFFSKVNTGESGRNRNITVNDVSKAIDTQKKFKSAVPNSVYMESFMFADVKLHVHIILLFTACLRHCYLPSVCMESVILPVVKNKGGDLSDIDNYRAIALSNVETKILETVILWIFNEDAECDMYQFGFKKGHSTGTCTTIVKRTIDYYLKRGSYVFTCFIDFSKAFDRVNFW